MRANKVKSDYGALGVRSVTFMEYCCADYVFTLRLTQDPALHL